MRGCPVSIRTLFSQRCTQSLSCQCNRRAGKFSSEIPRRYITRMAEDETENRKISGDSGESESPRRCALWISRKGRFCSNTASSTSQYCGNHGPVAAETRVPCPIDPTHTILKEAVASHVKKCPATKHLQHSEGLSYFSQGINGGSDGEEENSTAADVRNLNTAVNPSVQGDPYQSHGSKRAAIAGLSSKCFWELVKRIEFVHETHCQEAEEIILQPSQCLKWWDPARDRRLPFKEKHVSQQASLLGNLEAFGLLQSQNRKADDEGDRLQDPTNRWIYVEFGAGRGYLSHMLCDSYGVSAVVLVERRAYKFKADRTLRQILGVSLERLRTDIEDLNLEGVKTLQGRKYVAISKHLCGPATDLTLRCCLNKDRGNCVKSFDTQDQLASPVLEGIGIATCCHHLCQWKSYVNKPFFRLLGFSVNDFNMITWLTSWGVNQTEEHGEPETEAIVAEAEESLRQAGREPAESADGCKVRLSEAMDSLDLAARISLGRKCKQILDHGRLLWLKEQCMEAKIVKYMSPEVTPENEMLLARKSLV